MVQPEETENTQMHMNTYPNSQSRSFCSWLKMSDGWAKMASISLRWAVSGLRSGSMFPRSWSIISLRRMSSDGLVTCVIVRKRKKEKQKRNGQTFILKTKRNGSTRREGRQQGRN